MKITNYRKALFLLVILLSLFFGLWAESKFPDELVDVRNIDSFLLNALRNGQVVCTEKIGFDFVYPNQTKKISTDKICDVLWKS